MRRGSGIPAVACLALYAVAQATTSEASVDALGAATVLQKAASLGDIETIKQKLGVGEGIDVGDERGMTALHHAAVTGRVEVAALLLDHGANPNALAEGQMTPLHFAAMLAHPELAGLLLRRGARHDIRNGSGMMPIHLAANEKVVNVLAAAGADVNALTTKGLSPLHTARHGLVARALIEHKADLRIRSPRGRTAMDTAGIETLERVGLSIHSVMMGRLRGIVGQMPVTLTNVSAQPIRDLALAVRSPACSLEVTPTSVPELIPGMNADMIITLTRDPNVADGEYPVYLTITGNGRKLGETDLKVDTSQKVTPQDQGMIRMAKGQIRPAASRWFYLVYAAAPLLVIAAWLLFRKRSTSAASSDEG